MLKAIGYSVNQVAEALQTAFNMLAAEVGNVLKAIGYALEDVAKALGAVFGLVEDGLKSVLVSIGFDPDDVDDILDIDRLPRVPAVLLLLSPSGRGRAVRPRPSTTIAAWPPSSARCSPTAPAC